MPDSHCPTKTLSEHGDMEKRRLFHVPAKFKLLTSCDLQGFCNFRCTSDEFSTNFAFDPSLFRSLSNSSLTNYRLNYVGQMLKFPCYVNRGLWDNLSLPRTTPDKHVELSSVCVSPPGATSSRLDGPSEKVRVRKPQLMFPNGTREAFVPWIKGRTAGPLIQYSQSGTRI